VRKGEEGEGERVKWVRDIEIWRCESGADGKRNGLRKRWEI